MYSILRNGLRDLSNSHLMSSGAAYGAGIYLSTQFATASGYSLTITGSRYDGNINQTNLKILPTQRFLLVVEFINDLSYNKGSGIFVVTR